MGHHPRPIAYAAGMTGCLLLEMRPTPDRDWMYIAELGPRDQEGSLSDNHAEGRDVILFACQDVRSVIHRSASGMDFEASGGTVRLVIPASDCDLLAELTDGQSYERDIVTDRGLAVRARWTHHSRA